jgi:hypothetical protein
MAEVKIPPSPDYGAEVKQGEQVTEPTPNARQGVTHHNVRYVLAISLSGVVVLFALIYFVFFA